MHSTKNLLHFFILIFGVHLLEHSIDIVANHFAPAVIGWMASQLFLSWIYDE